ncbi:hypothetical protein CSOJ01_12835 [Colletotrichum sojae]|uniref:Uncharacterized protein n=1 Tax=Colletotrichum sojae TaxID=2175907 RepID=A0A8H6MM45_9PEZI|nr:hypothetical protein CSOJ01_12835 [Colletotrichum sojae]
MSGSATRPTTLNGRDMRVLVGRQTSSSTRRCERALTAQQRSTGGRDVMDKPPGYVAPTPLPEKWGGWDPRRGMLHAPDESSSSAPRHLPLNQSAFPRGQGCDAGESAKLGRPTPRTRGKAITAANQENQERSREPRAACCRQTRDRNANQGNVSQSQRKTSTASPRASPQATTDARP